VSHKRKYQRLYRDFTVNGVKVVVSIPDLGVSASDFIDELEAEGDDNDDQATTEEMFLRIPDNAETGEYTVRIEVYFDDMDKKNVKETLYLHCFLLF